MMIDALEETLKAVPKSGLDKRISTTTLMPSGALATVALHSENEGRFRVSDHASGRDDALTFGLTIEGPDLTRGREIAERLGLDFDGDSFFARDVSDDQLPGAIAYVADAAREWAGTVIARSRRQPEHALARVVESRLRKSLPNLTFERGQRLRGESTRQYRFDFVLQLDERRKMIFEIVNPDTRALQIAHLKLFDLKAAHPEWPREVVTERLDAWDNADMLLLSGVATHVRDVQHEWTDLARLAA